MAKKQVTLEQVTTAITRWQSKMLRAVRMIEKLEKQRKRIERAAARPPRVPPRPRAHAEIANLAETLGPAIQEAAQDAGLKSDDLGIPTFLQRKKLDPVAQQIADEQADLKRRKSAGRIATMKAKKAGDTRKMPLTGKAALDAIRNG